MNDRNNNENNNNQGNDLLLGDLFFPQQPPHQQQQQQQHGQPDNVEDDHDDDEDDEVDDDDGIDRDADGVYDGGVAGGSNNNNADDSSTAPARRRAADCDLILFFSCAESMDKIVSNHPILKEGIVVSIGLDKNTKLGAVFRRYIEFCNEHSNSKDRIEESELEFYHCQLLNKGDTAEASALMKNDRIKVRRDRSAEREKQAEHKRLERESDREYFKQLRNLSPDLGGNKYCDVIFDCKGMLADGNGRNQQVLSTSVRGHSVILSKRCKWLGSIIQTAREERAQRLANTTPMADEMVGGGLIEDGEEPHSVPEGNIILVNASSSLQDDNDETNRTRVGDEMAVNNAVDDDDQEDDEMAVLPYPAPRNQPQPVLARSDATEIEDDDNEDDNRSDNGSLASARRSQQSLRSRSLAENNSANALSENNDLLVVILDNHTPDAVKLLMEYCYTNRVIALGYDAFVQACRTKPVKPNGPVPPHSSRRWPNNGHPKISFSVAIAGIALAEEAGMHRLSLMCEIAATHLVSPTNAVEALCACTKQKLNTGNPLPRLREVAMATTLKFGPRGLYKSSEFRNALEERNSSIIPTLLSGTLDAIVGSEKKSDIDNLSKKRSFSTMTDSYFDELDRKDNFIRERERRQRRFERAEQNPEHLIDGDLFGEPLFSSNNWSLSEIEKRANKNISHNMGGFSLGRANLYPSRDSFSNRYSGMTTRRRNSSRRRGSDRN